MNWVEKGIFWEVFELESCVIWRKKCLFVVIGDCFDCFLSSCVLCKNSTKKTSTP